MQQQIIEKIWHYQELFLPLQPQIDNGTLADRLGNGLQNRVGQFDSARYLTRKGTLLNEEFLFYLFLMNQNPNVGENCQMIERFLSTCCNGIHNVAQRSLAKDHCAT